MNCKFVRTAIYPFIARNWPYKRTYIFNFIVCNVSVMTLNPPLRRSYEITKI